MKKIFFILLCAMCAFTVKAQSSTREMRITPLDGASLRQENGAWVIRLADIDSIDFRTINSTTPDEGEGVEPDEQEHAYVDLGLPSRTLWATCNIGASTPLEYGNYFAWGEVQTKEVYSEATYPWFRDDTIPAYEIKNELGLWETVPEEIKHYILKYNNENNPGIDGFVDNKTTLDADDDAATAHWGNDWCTPTYEQMQELHYECTWEAQSAKNDAGEEIKYLKITGPSGKSIYLPGVGYRSDADLNNTGAGGSYWTSTVSGNLTRAHYLGIDMYGSHSVRDDGERYHGLVVRPVRSSR